MACRDRAARDWHVFVPEGCADALALLQAKTGKAVEAAEAVTSNRLLVLWRRSVSFSAAHWWVKNALGPSGDPLQWRLEIPKPAAAASGTAASVSTAPELVERAAEMSVLEKAVLTARERDYKAKRKHPYVLSDTVLGKGTFGTVVAAHHCDDPVGELGLAVKMPRRRDDAGMLDALVEVAALDRCRGEHIVDLLDTFTHQSGDLALVFNRAETSLAAVLRGEPTGFELERMVHVGAGILRGQVLEEVAQV